MPLTNSTTRGRSTKQLKLQKKHDKANYPWILLFGSLAPWIQRPVHVPSRHRRIGRPPSAPTAEGSLRILGGKGPLRSTCTLVRGESGPPYRGPTHLRAAEAFGLFNRFVRQLDTPSSWTQNLGKRESDFTQTTGLIGFTLVRLVPHSSCIQMYSAPFQCQTGFVMEGRMKEAQE